MATVTHGILEEPLHHLVVERFLTGVDDTLQKEVSLFQLIPEEAVILRELELAHAILGDGAGTEHIQPREEPAAARGALVRDTLALYLIGEVGIEVVEALAVNR